VIALDETDLRDVVEARKAGDETAIVYLLERFRELL
jgi:hypothetical protein